MTPGSRDLQEWRRSALWAWVVAQLVEKQEDLREANVHPDTPAEVRLKNAHTHAAIEELKGIFDDALEALNL